jgi:hypothetical protein
MTPLMNHICAKLRVSQPLRCIGVAGAAAMRLFALKRGDRQHSMRHPTFSVSGGRAASFGTIRPLLAAVLLILQIGVGTAEEGTKDNGVTLAEQLFLDRLMQAESGGRQFAKNPASSALGPFQFISSTFREVILRHFPQVTEGKSDAEILALRVDPKVARDAALAYTRANAAFLQERGAATEPAHLRLAFLVGPSGAANVILAEPETPVSNLLSKAALEANPFLDGMTAKQLIERSEREAAGLERLPTFPASAKQAVAKPEIRIRCNLGRASCRRWVQLAKGRAARMARRAANKATTRDAD